MPLWCVNIILALTETSKGFLLNSSKGKTVACLKQICHLNIDNREHDVPDSCSLFHFRSVPDRSFTSAAENKQHLVWKTFCVMQTTDLQQLLAHTYACIALLMV